MVKDNGAGIPKDKLQSLFKEFYKVEDSLNLNPSGIGLGLFICKRVVEGCGGQIKVLRSVHALENPFNQGTTFEFTMPIS
jgi:two-component system, sensor histidine kinase